MFFIMRIAVSIAALWWYAPVFGTPLIALREANNCGACHKPGRAQKPVLFRRCTLDCQGCHIDPAGGGPRSQWGYYYTHSTASSLKFFDPIDPLQDTSRIDLHYDGRVIQRKTSSSTRTFPMNSEFSVRVRPLVEYLHFTYQNSLLGRLDDELFRIVKEGDRRFREKYSVMVDQLPLGMYVRGYRGSPMYGLRRSNHSLWIRERIGLDQFATTDAYELGGTPNVPFFRVSKMLGDPYVADEFKQKGNTFHGGLRGVTLGWHLNASSWDSKSNYADIKMKAYGAGANIFSVLLYGERNIRNVSLNSDVTLNATPSFIHPSSTIDEYTIAYAGLPGFMTGMVYERYADARATNYRRSLFIDLHPIPFLQFELWRRFEYGDRNVSDTIAVAHLYADF